MASASSIAASIASKTKTKKKHFVAQKVKLFRASDPLLSVVMWGVNHSVSHLFSCLMSLVSCLMSLRWHGSPSECLLRPSDVPSYLQLAVTLGTDWQIGDGGCPAVGYRTASDDLWLLCRGASSHHTCVAFCNLFARIFRCTGHRQWERERERERGVSALNSSLASCCAHVG